MVSNLWAADIRGSRIVRRRFIAGLALVSLAALAACGGVPASPSNNADASTAVARVSGGMGSLAAAGQSANLMVVTLTAQKTFEPATLAVPVGTAINWVNSATTPQTVSFDPASALTKGDVVLPNGVAPFDSGAIAPGQTWTHTFTTAGMYRYTSVANEAAGMKGVIVVS